MPRARSSVCITLGPSRYRPTSLATQLLETPYARPTARQLLPSRTTASTTYRASSIADPRHRCPRCSDTCVHYPVNSDTPLSAKSRHPRSRSSGNSEVGHDSEMVARPDAIDRFVEDPRAGADLERRSPMLAASHEDVVEPAERPVPSADGPGSDTWSTLPLRGDGKRLGGAPAILVLEGSLVSSPEAPVAQPG